MADFARADRFKRLRARSHLSQERAAVLIGVSGKSIRNWEQGKGIKWASAQRVAAFYTERLGEYIDPDSLTRHESEVADEAPDDERAQIVEEFIEVKARLEELAGRLDLTPEEPPAGEDDPELSEAEQEADAEEFEPPDEEADEGAG